MNLKRLTDPKALPWLVAALAALVALAMAAGGGDGATGSQEERRIAEVLSAMAGAGDVEVALFYGGTRSDGLTGGASPPTGAVVVAQGADDLAVRLSLLRAVRTLLGLPETAVDVFVMEEDRR